MKRGTERNTAWLCFGFPSLGFEGGRREGARRGRERGCFLFRCGGRAWSGGIIILLFGTFLFLRWRRERAMERRGNRGSGLWWGE